MGNAALKSVMLDPSFDKLSLADQTEVMRRAGASDDMLSDWVKSTASGPVMSPSAIRAEGFTDTSGDVARILEQYHEPNRIQDVGPKLVEFGILASTAGVPGAAAKGVTALRGLSAGAKAKKIATVAGVAGGGIAADQTLQSLGVPAWLSEGILALGGLSTKPGRALLRAGMEVLSGETAAVEAAPAAARAARAMPSAVSRSAPVIQFPAASSTASAGVPTNISVPATRGATALATEAVAETAPVAARAATPATEAEDIVAAALRMRNENKLSGAQIISALKQSFGVPIKDGRKLVQGILDAEKGAAVSPLRVPRIEEGAQKVGRAAGMTKEEVRKATGPVLREALGEASPVLPKKALQSIIDKMKSLPVAEREAYVARAKDPKAMAQIENVRRTLEHLGLAVPAWMAAAIVGSQMPAAVEGGS